MAKNSQQLLEHPLMIVLITFLALLLILSLQESKKKSLVSTENLQKSQNNIALSEEQVEKKEKFFEQTQNDLYKEKLKRNELIKEKEEEITIQIPSTELTNNKEKNTITLDKTNYKLQNLQLWWQLLTKKK